MGKGDENRAVKRDGVIRKTDKNGKEVSFFEFCILFLLKEGITELE